MERLKSKTETKGIGFSWAKISKIFLKKKIL
jgi:hypothetical protein